MAIEIISAWLVWIFPLIASLFVPLIGKYSEKARNGYAIIIATITAALAISLIPSVWNGEGVAITSTFPWIPEISAGVYIDPLSVLFTCLIAFFALIISIYSLSYMKGENGLTRYYYLILLFIGSMIGLVLSDNMLQMFIFWEMVGLCSYTLISFWYKKPESLRSGVKVFIMTRIGDACLLGAIGLLYYMFATLSFRGIIDGIQLGNFDTNLMIIVAFLVLGGAVAKSAQFPLFTWLYGAMEAPTSVSALLHAATMVKAGIYLLARFILIVAISPALIQQLMPLWFPTIAWIGVITAFIGATLALTTTDLKGVLAYSTISQIGFMMAALGTAAHSGGLIGIGWFASIFHMVSHAFFEGLGFLLAGGIIHAVGTRDMRLMGGLRKIMPISFILMIIMVLTTSGLPPFAAFFSKGLILTSVLEIGTTAGLIQTVLLFATTAITFAYCIRMFTLVFMGHRTEQQLKEHKVHELSKLMLIPAAILAVFCIIWGLSEPIIASFLDVNTHGLLAAFTSIEFPIFIILIIPTGLLVYFSYYKGFNAIRNIAKTNNPLSTMLRRAYFVDDFYNVIAKGIIKISEVLTRMENALFGRYIDRNLKVPTPLRYVARIEDTLFGRYIDEFGEKISDTAKPGKAMKLKQDQFSNYRNYIAAAVLGFILIVILIILTLGVI